MQAYHGVHAGTPYPQVQSLPYNYATIHVYIYISDYFIQPHQCAARAIQCLRIIAAGSSETRFNAPFLELRFNEQFMEIEPSTGNFEA